MFKTVESGVGTEVFAFVDDAEMVENYSRFCETISYKKKAFWFVSKGATNGALAYGDVSFNFSDHFAGTLDARSTYRGMSPDEVFELAGREKKLERPDGRGLSEGKGVRSYPEVIFGHGFVWNDVNKREWEHADKMFKELLESWFALPAMPTGTSKWIKFSKR